MKYLLFDTETTGLIQNSLQPLTKQPRVIEFFGLLLEASATDGELKQEELRSLHFRCNPGIPIPEIVTKITSIKDADVKELPVFNYYAGEVRKIIAEADAVVAHNLSYDKAMLGFEFQRVPLAKIIWPRGICTVEATESIRGARMRLSDLYEHLFGEKFENAHSAEADVRATARCFMELLRRGEV